MVQAVRNIRQTLPVMGLGVGRQAEKEAQVLAVQRIRIERQLSPLKKGNVVRVYVLLCVIKRSRRATLLEKWDIDNSKACIK